MCSTTDLMTLRECIRFFPGHMTVESIRNRVKRGVDGVYLKAKFDGRRWWSCEEWVNEFIDELTEKQLKRKQTKIVPTQVELLISNFLNER